MYGSSCCLVLSVGQDVSCFTLDPSMGEFILTTPKVLLRFSKCPCRLMLHAVCRTTICLVQVGYLIKGARSEACKLFPLCADACATSRQDLLGQ